MTLQPDKNKLFINRLVIKGKWKTCWVKSGKDTNDRSTIIAEVHVDLKPHDMNSKDNLNILSNSNFICNTDNHTQYTQYSNGCMVVCRTMLFPTAQWHRKQNYFLGGFPSIFLPNLSTSKASDCFFLDCLLMRHQRAGFYGLHSA